MSRFDKVSSLGFPQRRFLLEAFDRLNISELVDPNDPMAIHICRLFKKGGYGDLIAPGVVVAFFNQERKLANGASKNGVMIFVRPHRFSGRHAGASLR